jgi:hypothetical protein
MSIFMSFSEGEKVIFMQHKKRFPLLQTVVRHPIRKPVIDLRIISLLFLSPDHWQGRKDCPPDPDHAHPARIQTGQTFCGTPVAPTHNASGTKDMLTRL